MNPSTRDKNTYIEKIHNQIYIHIHTYTYTTNIKYTSKKLKRDAKRGRQEVNTGGFRHLTPTHEPVPVP